MLILALGNSPAQAISPESRFRMLNNINAARLQSPLQLNLKARGFTLLELMVVVAIIAIATAGVTLAIPDGSQTALERDALRLAALLDAARVHSRSSGLSVTWHATPEGFKFKGLPQSKNKITGKMEDLFSLPRNWLSPATSANPDILLTLGPEPIIAKQQVVLTNSGRSLTVATDGLRPFSIELGQVDNLEYREL